MLSPQRCGYHEVTPPYCCQPLPHDQGGGAGRGDLTGNLSEASFDAMNCRSCRWDTSEGFRQLSTSRVVMGEVREVPPTSQTIVYELLERLILPTGWQWITEGGSSHGHRCWGSSRWRGRMVFRCWKGQWRLCCGYYLRRVDHTLFILSNKEPRLYVSLGILRWVRENFL